MIIEVRGLKRRFAGVTALRQVDFAVGAGEAVAVFGPNGAGKTTLLRILATLLRPTAGDLRLFGNTLRDGGAAARRRIGFLSHNSFLYPDLSPAENLEFYACLFGVAEPERRVRELVERVGLLGWAQRPVRTLSRGLEQRCALARALIHSPDLLLLDEPFNGLDVDASAMLADALRAAHRDGTTVLLTTHDLARGVELCDRAVVLARGRTVWDGPLGNSAAAFRELYRAAVRGEATPAGAEG